MRRLLISIVVLLAGCAQLWTPDKMSTPQERADAARVITLLRAKNFGPLQAAADSALQPQLSPDAVAKVAVLVPQAGDPQLQTVSINSFTTDTGTRTLKAFNYELGAGDRWAVVQVMLDTSKLPSKIDGFRVFPAPARPTTMNNFSFAGKSAIHYLWLVGIVLAILISLAGAITAWRSPRFATVRWLWILGSLVSFCTLSLNWTTGQFGISPVSFMVLGASAMRASPLDPWIVSFAIPVVALIVLIRARMGAPSDDSEFSETA